jgi:dihydroorotase-like cyclic amidohydrolase
VTKTFDLVLSGGTRVNQGGEGLRDVGVRDGESVAIGDRSRDDAGERVDGRRLHILPGVIDSQAHCPERRHAPQGGSRVRLARRGLQEGVVDAPGPDHALHNAGGEGQTLSGQPRRHDGRAATVLLLDHVNAGRLTLARSLDVTCAGPARRRFRRRFRGRRSQATRDDLQRRNRIVRRLDAL